MITAYYKKRIFYFCLLARTSKKILHNRTSWFLYLKEKNRSGIGECAPLEGLSRDNLSGYEKKIQWLCKNINKDKDELYEQLQDYPSIVFGLEQAFLTFEKNHFVFFPSDFTSGIQGISINGLIWMGDVHFMQAQLDEKIQQGFKCIKIKIGALSFDAEYDFLSRTREKYTDIELRLDANGAFSPEEILKKLERLSSLNIHSIEQPISPGQKESMAQLCRETPIPIVLDEELIGVYTYKDKQKLIDRIAPHYLVLKPSFCGGFRMTKEWINIAQEKNIPWWVTSALESNVGLSAISQWTYVLGNNLPQGLGTNKLYSNNISSPLHSNGPFLYYQPDRSWDFSNLK